MGNDRLNGAVEALLVNRRFLRRFQRDPENALRRFDLSREEVRAVKSGDERELLRLGLDPGYIWPKTGTALTLQSWTVRNAKRVAPAALLAAAFLAWPSAGQARRIAPPGLVGNRGQRRAFQRIAEARAHFLARHGDREAPSVGPGGPGGGADLPGFGGGGGGGGGRTSTGQ